MGATQAWLRHLKALSRRSIALGTSAFLLAGLFIFVMIKVSDFSTVPMSAALLAAALGLAVFIPKPAVNFVYALIALIFGLRALVTGTFLFGVSATETALYYWAGVVVVFCAVLWFLYRGYGEATAPPNNALDSDSSAAPLRARDTARQRGR
jgi:hypothetical protein